ncbi:tyrosine-type recombinase/integrase [Shumkonia mesophila]|uniref:tyrosine-type recombinase/integrase n=1 Tax=Shumkonia mesophila TaxID=2838854 RepID=UPI00293493D6|nr:site-specific integrase [Shumkonia mesophila]
MKPWIEPKTWPSKRAKGGVSGSFVVWFEDSDGKRTTKSFAWSKYQSKTAAKDAAREFLENGAKDKPNADALKITVRQGCELWLKAVQTTGIEGREPVGKSTLGPYKNHINNYILPTAGSKKLIDLDRKAVGQYREKLISWCEENGKSRGMAKRAFSSLRSMLAYCDSQGLYEDRTARMKIIHHEGRTKKRVDVPQPHEVRAMLAAADKLRKATKADFPNLGNFGRGQRRQMRTAWRKYRPAVYMLYETGIRIGELLGLPWERVDLDRRIIEVAQAAQESEIGAPKSETSYRVLAISQKLADMLRLLKRMQRGNPKLVFGSRTGKPQSQANFSRDCWRVLIQIAGVRRIGRHAMRHFRASVLIAMGRDPKEVKEELGHESIQITMNLYGHLFERRRVARRKQHDTELERFWTEEAGFDEVKA